MSKGEAAESGKALAVNSIIGGAAAIAISLVLLIVFALFVSSGKVPENMQAQLVMVSAFFGGAGGALTARLRSDGAALPKSLAAALAACIIRLVISLFLPCDKLFSSQNMSITACILAGGIIVGLVGRKHKKRRHK